MKYLFVFFSVIILACNDNNSSSGLKHAPVDTVVKVLPEWFSSRTFQEDQRKISTYLKLNSIENGFDSLSIRIWINCYYDIYNLITIEKSPNKWSATFYSYKRRYSGTEEALTFDLLDIKKEEKSPASSWERFSRDLLNTGLTNLPDFMNLNGDYQLPTDGDDVTVEVGTANRYLVYSYPEIFANRGIKEGPEKLYLALQLIEKEFNFRMPCQNKEIR